MESNPTRDRRLRNRRLQWGLAALAVLALAGGFVVLSDPAGAFGFHRRGGHHGMGMEFARWRIGRLLESVGASEAQRSQVEGILEGAFASMHDMRPDRAEIHEVFTSTLVGESVDREALEALRLHHVERIATTSKRIVDAIADSAEVLDPEQRARIAEEIEEMHRWRRGH